MKKSELKQLIKEEIQRSLNESFYDNFKLYEDEFKKRGFKWVEEAYHYGGVEDTFYKKFPLGVFSVNIISHDNNNQLPQHRKHQQYYYDFTFTPFPKYKKYLFGLIKSKHPQFGKSIDLGKGNIDFGEGLFLVDDNTFKTEFFDKIDKALDGASKITDVEHKSPEDSKGLSTYYIDQMKESELKQLIKEEIQKILNEDHKSGDKVIYGGLGTVTIDKEENGLIYFTDRKGNKYKKNYAQFKQASKPFEKYLNPITTPLHEDNKRLYIDGIKSIFSRYGKKAQGFVNNKLNGRDLNSLTSEEAMELNIALQNYLAKQFKPSNSNIDPNILGKGKGHLGSTYTGD